MLRDRLLGRQFPIFCAFGGYQADPIMRSAHDVARYIVGHDPICAFGLPLGGSVGGEIVGLGGKPD